MADSDDDLFDDIDLDDAALAALDAEETKYTISFTQTQPARPPPPANLPAPKRLKTTQGWVASGAIKRDASLNDFDDLPDISVQGDGTYGMQARRVAGSSRVLTPSANKGPVPRPLPPATRTPQPAQPAARILVPSGRPPVRANAVQPSAPPRHVTRPPTQGHYPQPAAASAPFRAVSNAPRTGPAIPLNNSQSNIASASARPAEDGAAVERMQADIDALRLQLEQLGRSNEEARAALKEAQDARFAKEGEVSLLRRGIDKTAQDHVASLAKLKSAKEAAEAAQAQIQREMREEMERLRTQYTFKRHELDTAASARKAPGTARALRRGMDPPPTPVPMPSQMRGWSAKPTPAGARTPRRSGSLTTTPTRARHSPRKPRGASLLPPANGEPRAPRGTDGALPGFVNAFAPSTPRRADKGKGRLLPASRETPARDAWPASDFDDVQQPMSARAAGRHLSPPSSPTRHERGDMAGHELVHDQRPIPSLDLALQDAGVDVGYVRSDPPLPHDMGMADEESAMGERDFDEMSDGERRMFEVLDEAEPIVWKDELQAIVFSHATPWGDSMTFQSLMGPAFPEKASLEARKKYSSACASMLRIFGASSKDDSWDQVVESLSISFIDMIAVLMICGLHRPLTALLELLANLCFCLPTFSSAVLSAGTRGDDDGRDIVEHMCTLLSAHASGPENETLPDAESRRRLIEAALGLLEAVNWRMPEVLEDRFAPVLQHENVLECLLRSTQPSWMIYRTCRLLSSLAARSSLFKYILPAPEVDDLEDTYPKPQLVRVETVCACLTDTKRSDAEAESMREAILTLLSVLLVGHPDASGVLLESDTLAPALVIFLYRLSCRIFEDDPALLASSSLAASTLQTTNEALYLLHELVINASPQGGARRYLAGRLQNPRRVRPLLGVHHMFHVALGRLSYGDLPDWIPPSAHGDWRGMHELALDLLDCLVEGPEADTVYGVYQGGWDEEETQTQTPGLPAAEDDEVMNAEMFDALSPSV